MGSNGITTRRIFQRIWITDNNFIYQKSMYFLISEIQSLISEFIFWYKKVWFYDNRKLNCNFLLTDKFLLLENQISDIRKSALKFCVAFHISDFWRRTSLPMIALASSLSSERNYSGAIIKAILEREKEIHLVLIKHPKLRVFLKKHIIWILVVGPKVKIFIHFKRYTISIRHICGVKLVLKSDPFRVTRLLSHLTHPIYAAGIGSLACGPAGSIFTWILLINLAWPWTSRACSSVPQQPELLPWTWKILMWWPNEIVDFFC